jgi:hypothetical protein
MFGFSKSRLWFGSNLLLVSLMAVGCSQNAVRRPAVATAPSVSGEAQAHIRGVSDPNAQFTLSQRTTEPSATGAATAAASATPCSASSLQVYEAAASMNGDNRTLRLAFKNRGEAACSLSGYPAIELQDDRGVPVASIAVHQTGSASLSGTVGSSAQNAAETEPVMIVLRPSSEATFEIGWLSGDGCPVVSRFSIAMPRTVVSGSTFSGSFLISHPVNVCKGEVMVTSLAMSGMS